MNQSPSVAQTDRPAAPWAQPLALSWWWLALVVVAALDLVLTHLVLSIGGHEVNPVARGVLRAADFPGLIIYKFVLVTGVVLIAEFIARHAAATARRVALLAVGISALPVVWSTLMVLQLLLTGRPV